MSAIVSFYGNSGSGKTTLIESCVRELKKKGFTVAVIKHAHHGFEMDKPGKDSWRFAQAGTDIVAVSSPGRLAVIERVDGELYYDQVISRIDGKVDIILVEGFKQLCKVKVEVSDSENIKDVGKIVDFLIEQIQKSKK
ncbi:molybdopterin-guanine dinucleotide biosynthesis protein B [Chloroflexota bacterium]